MVTPSASENCCCVMQEQELGRGSRLTVLRHAVLPDHPDPRVALKDFVGRDDGDVFDEGLRQNLAIERIGMMPGQPEKA